MEVCDTAPMAMQSAMVQGKDWRAPFRNIPAEPLLRSPDQYSGKGILESQCVAEYRASSDQGIRGFDSRLPLSTCIAAIQANSNGKGRYTFAAYNNLLL